jgi:hypothetical protein
LAGGGGGQKRSQRGRSWSRSRKQERRGAGEEQARSRAAPRRGKGGEPAARWEQGRLWEQAGLGADGGEAVGRGGGSEGVAEEWQRGGRGVAVAVAVVETGTQRDSQSSQRLTERRTETQPEAARPG